VSPGQTLNYFDVVGNRFGIFNSAGALKLEADDAPVASLRMTSRTYARSGEGTFGQAVSGVADLEGTSGARFVTGLTCSPELRSNVGLVNTSASAQQVRIILYAGNGALVRATEPIWLDAGRQAQWSLRDIFGVEGRGLSVEFRPEPGSTTPIAYAAVIDNASGDPTYYPAMQPQRIFYLPGVARVTGIGLSQFASDVSLTNSGETPATVTVTFLEKERDNSDSNPTVSITLGPRETRQMDDALSSLFGLTETYGALRVESSTPNLVVAGRIFTDSTTTAGTVGQQVDPIGPNGWFSRGSILGLRHDAAYRSNVGLLNPHGRPVTASLWLKLSQGVAIGHATVTIAPHSYLQKNLTALFPGVSLPAGQVMTVTVDSADSPIFPFATVVDNVSQDLTFSPGLR